MSEKMDAMKTSWTAQFRGKWSFQNKPAEAAIGWSEF